MIKKRAEDYLRLIHELDTGLGARSVDIARKLDITKASVSEMLRKLANKRLVKLKPYSKIKPTEKGKKLAEKFYDKHRVIKNFIKHLCNYSDERAELESHELEHSFSQETIDILSKFIEGKIEIKNLPNYVG